MLLLDEEKHAYTWDGQPVPGVTSIIRSALGDPFRRVPRLELEHKRRLGQAAHKACELDACGRLDEGSVHAEIEPYLLAWRHFRAEMPFRVVLSEEKIFSRVYGFAGRPDFYLLLLLHAMSAYAVVDIKTGLPGFSAGLQTAGYALLLEEKFGPEQVPARRFALRLNPTGRYKFEEFDQLSDTRDFLACLAVHRMKERTQWS